MVSHYKKYSSNDAHGGKLVAHHMEFDAGIIAKEMISHAMWNLLEKFELFARNGVCTMDPAIGRWVRQSVGEDDGSSKTQNVLALRKLVEYLVPEDRKLLDHHHSAGTNSLLVLKLIRVMTRSNENQ